MYYQNLQDSVEIKKNHAFNRGQRSPESPPKKYNFSPNSAGNRSPAGSINVSQTQSPSPEYFSEYMPLIAQTEDTTSYLLEMTE